MPACKATIDDKALMFWRLNPSSYNLRVSGQDCPSNDLMDTEVSDVDSCASYCADYAATFVWTPEKSPNCWCKEECSNYETNDPVSIYDFTYEQPNAITDVSGSDPYSVF